MTEFGPVLPSPMPVRRLPSVRTAFLTYEPYYGLKEKPFSLSVDPRFLYKSRSHAPVFDDLLAGIRRREGLIVLTGDIGTGKTTLCRAVLAELDRKTFSTFVPDPFVSREDLLKMLLIDFGVMSVDDLKSGRLNGASRPDLSYPLYEFLNSLVPLQAFAVLIIDEAQNLSLPLLEEIRILSDLEAPEKLLQVVLVGQLELRAKLKLQEMRQVDQRVSVRCDLEALNLEAVAGYITHRLAVAGGTSDRVRFSSDAIDLIFRTSKGVPRVINLVCDRSLHRGHLARMPEVDADIVRVAMADMGLEARVPQPPAFLASELDIMSQPFGHEVRANEKETPEQGFFDEDDLLHAIQTQTTSAQPSEPAAPPKPKSAEASTAESTGGNRALPLLVESRRSFSGDTFSPRLRWRRRARRLMAVAATVLLFGAGFGAVSYWQSQEALSAPIDMPPLPAPPLAALNLAPTPRSIPDALPPVADRPAAAAGAAAPGVGLYAIDVALFNSAVRADRLVQELSAVGYRAYQKDLNLGERGHMYEVLVGTYPTREAADADASRIRAIRGYQDAKVVSTP